VPSDNINPIVAVSVVCRILKDKGIREVLTAASLLKERNINVEIRLVGDCDPNNPATMKDFEINKSVDRSEVVWHGFDDNLNKVYQDSDIALLHSYREGLPKSYCATVFIGKHSGKVGRYV